MALGLAPGSPNRNGGAGRAGVRQAIHQVKGNLKHGGAVAGHGPAAHPATVLVVVNTDHLIQVLITGEVNTVTLMEGHRLGGWRVVTQGWMGEKGAAGIQSRISPPGPFACSQ